MCAHSKKRKWWSVQLQVLLAAILGLFCGFFPEFGLQTVAFAIMSLFTNALKLVSLPIIFLCLLTSLTGVKHTRHFRWMSARILQWTIITTVIASIVALILFLLIQPAQLGEVTAVELQVFEGSFAKYLLDVIPANPFQPFIDGNVVSILLLAIALGLGLSNVPGREKVHDVLEPLLAGMMKIVRVLIRLIPLTVWAGIVLSFEELKEGHVIRQLGWYLLVVLSANLIQGFVVLPLLLKGHGIHPWYSMRKFAPALTVAFFSKSSVATLPIAMRTAEQELGVSSSLARFAFPICTTINMNGCAAFILSTTLFVAISQGVAFTIPQMVLWVAVSSIAAIGNAGVPMGCFFLSSAILASMNVPIGLMSLILPFYSFIDMVETALNVWSDACVAMMVNTQMKARGHEEVADCTK